MAKSRPPCAVCGDEATTVCDSCLSYICPSCDSHYEDANICKPCHKQLLKEAMGDG